MNAEQFLKENYNQLYHLLKQDEIGFDFMDDYANQSKWIRVEDAPMNEGDYLCRLWVGGGTWMEVCVYEDCNWYYCGSNKTIEEEIGEFVTHWQPLPTFNEK